MRWRYLIWVFVLTQARVYSSQVSTHEENIQGRINMKNKHVLISGAGIAGLTLAYWLKQHGFTPTLVERHPTLRTSGQKIDIRGVAIEVIRRMEAYNSIFEARTDIQGATIVDRTGKPLTNLKFALTGSRIEEDLEIVRGDLCKILFDRIENVECLFGDSISRIVQNEEGVLVEFEKSQPRIFDLVVGADGLHSVVRKLAFGDEAQFLHELGLCVSVFTIPNFLNLDRWEIEYFEPRKMVNMFNSRGDPDAKGGLAFSLKSVQTVPRKVSEQQKLLEEVFADAGWEVSRLLAAMKDATDFYFDSVAQIHMSHWSEGRVVLLGDAGYASSPSTGQGTSVAIVGAYVLAGELAQAQGDYKIAFSEYERNLRQFVNKNQKLAEANVRLMSSSWVTWLAHQLIRLLPSWSIQWIRTWGVKRIHEAANDLVLKNYPCN